MGFIESVLTVFGKFATFRGRASRSEYWWFVLFYLMVSSAVGAAAGGRLMAIIDTALILPSAALTARRLHDIGKSGWWQLLEVVPLIHALALFGVAQNSPVQFTPLVTAAICWLTLLFWLVKASDPFSNAYDE